MGNTEPIMGSRQKSVPAVYPASANLQVYSLLSVRRINNLWKFNVAFSSIPTRASNFPLLLSIS